MTAPLVSYDYTHSAGCTPNRKIEFYRDRSDNASSIRAVVFAKRNGEWIQSSNVSGTSISVDMKRTSEKVHDFFEEHELGCESQQIVEKRATELNVDQQNAILKTLQSKGDWKILITTDIGDDPRFEKIVELCFHNLQPRYTELNQQNIIEKPHDFDAKGDIMTASLQSYQYTHGAGCTPDRKIDFYRDRPDDASSIRAVISAWRGGIWVEFSVVSGASISIAMKATLEKVRDFFEEHELGGELPYYIEKCAVDLKVEQQDAIFRTLDPEGSWRVSALNETFKNGDKEVFRESNDPRFENITTVRIYDLH